MHSISKSKSSHASIHRRILSLIHHEQCHTYNITNTTKTLAHDGDRHGRWTPTAKEPSRDHSSSEIPGEPARYWRTCAPKQVATDVRVLLTDTVTHHLRGVLEPLDRHWPTRPPPKKVRVNDRLAPHQPAPSGRQHLPIPARRSPVPNMALIKQASTAESTTTRMRDRHRRRRCGNYFYIQLNKSSFIN